tara:strand:- start:508 stop:876 length:369 start_codon:yes stop_codon:yes gene_type:complete
MGINSTEVSYNFGQLGSVYTTAASAAITPPTGKVFIAITTLATTTFDTTDGLVAENNVTQGREYIGTGTAAHDAASSPDLGESGVGGLVINDTVAFPSGITIFGRWTEIDIANGSVIAYIGD